MKTIELCEELEGHRGAIIIPAQTGIVYTNQAGGYSCLHPEMEGYIISVKVDHAALWNFFVAEPGRYQGWCDDGITAKDAEELEKCIPYKIDGARLTIAMEAWLPIIYDGEQAILTWENSD